MQSQLIKLWTLQSLQSWKFWKVVLTVRKHTCYNINQGMNCKTKNVCYLLICESCDDQYVGETKRQLNHGINGHNSDIRLKKKSPPKHFEK